MTMQRGARRVGGAPGGHDRIMVEIRFWAVPPLYSIPIKQAKTDKTRAACCLSEGEAECRVAERGEADAFFAETDGLE